MLLYWHYHFKNDIHSLQAASSWFVQLPFPSVALMDPLPERPFERMFQRGSCEGSRRVNDLSWSKYPSSAVVWCRKRRSAIDPSEHE